MDLNHPESTGPVDERALYSNSGSEIKEEETTRIPDPLPTFPPLRHLSNPGSRFHERTTGPPLAHNSSRVHKPDTLIHNNTQLPSARHSSQARFPPAKLTQQPWSDSSSEYSSSEEEEPITSASKYQQLSKKISRPLLRRSTPAQAIDDPAPVPPKKLMRAYPHVIVQYPYQSGSYDKPVKAYHKSKALPRGRKVRQDYERRPLRRKTEYHEPTPRGTVIVESPGTRRAQKFYKDQIGFLSGREREIREKEGYERGSSTTQAVQTKFEHSNGEVRLHVDPSAHLSLSFNSDMEGRTIQINPTENGLADIIISGPRVEDEKKARSERDFLQPVDDYSRRFSLLSDPIFSTQQSASTRPSRVYQNESRHRLNTLHQPMSFAHEAPGQPPPPHENSPSDHNLPDFPSDGHEKLQNNDAHQFGGLKQDRIKQRKQAAICTNCYLNTAVFNNYTGGSSLCNSCSLFLERYGIMRSISPDTIKKRESDTSSASLEQVKTMRASDKIQAVKMVSQTDQASLPKDEDVSPGVSSAGPQTVSPDDPPPFPPETIPTHGQTEVPRGHVLEKPTEKSPDDPESIRDDLSSFESESAKIVPPNARWTKIDRRLVNPEALEEAKERFEERRDCVIVLRVLTKVEIQALANRTRDIRETREANEKEAALLSHLESKHDTQNHQTTEELSTYPIVNRSDAPSPAMPDKSLDTKGQFTDISSVPHEAKITEVSDRQPAASSVPVSLEGKEPLEDQNGIDATIEADFGSNDRMSDIIESWETSFAAVLDANQSFEPTEKQSRDTLNFEDDNISVISSYADSVFSVESLVSAGTDLSRNSGFTADEITTATKRLIVIFQDDTVLKPLYLHALADPAIGPSKLERNLRRLFKQCAHDLEKEAKDPLEVLGSRLVSYQARSLAKSVVSRFGGNNPQPVVPGPQIESESSDDEEQVNTFDDSVFEDLAVFSTFLMGSGAFQKLRENVERFASSKKSQSKVDKLSSTDTATIDDFSITEAEPGSVDTQEAKSILSSEGIVPDHTTLLASIEEPLHNTAPVINEKFSYTTPAAVFCDTEPRWRRARANSLNQNSPLPGVEFERGRRKSVGILDAKGEFSIPTVSSPASRSLPYRRRVQLRWQCRCAKTFICNVVELRTKGVEDLVARMQRSIGSKVTVTPISPTNSSGGASPFQRLQLHFRNIILKLTSNFKKQASQGSLPHHNGTPTVSTAPIPNTSTPQQRMLHLLACMRAGRFRKSLSQDRVEDIKSDHELFLFLRKNFASQRGRIRRFLSINGVKDIFFVKLRVPSNGSVEVRRRNATCDSTICTCIPPIDRVGPQLEYHCTPVPPGTCPPVDPEYLAHMFNSPSCASEIDTWILDQLPKRAHGELHGKPRQPADGWGIYYQEGWDKEAVALAVMVVFVVASLIFGILWSHFKMDVQGAFGVSAYMVTACGIFVSYVAVKSEPS